jgi:hypothetical protein
VSSSSRRRTAEAPTDCRAAARADAGAPWWKRTITSFVVFGGASEGWPDADADVAVAARSSAASAVEAVMPTRRITSRTGGG